MAGKDPSPKAVSAQKQKNRGLLYIYYGYYGAVLDTSGYVNYLLAGNICLTHIIRSKVVTLVLLPWFGHCMHVLLCVGPRFLGSQRRKIQGYAPCA